LLGRFIRAVCLALERLGLNAKKKRLAKSKFGRYLVDCILLPPDVFKILRTHKVALGKYPNILFPKTFNEKLQRYKLTARRHRFTEWADKILVRDYVANRIGEDYLTKLFWTGLRLGEAPWASFPTQFVIKSNNGSGEIIIVSSKDQFNLHAAEIQTNSWLNRDQSLTYAEWQYRWITPRLMIEELLTDSSGGIPVDFKFFCFHGQPRFVQLDIDRFKSHCRVFVDLNYRRLPFGLIYPTEVEIPEKPSCWHEMIEISQALSADEPFLRIDLYNVGGSPRFGEMTLHPEAACGKFFPENIDFELGTFI
jgi:hypothetical protein